VSEEQNSVNVDTQEQNIDKKGKVKSVILEILMYAVILYLCIYIIPKYVVQRTIVDGPSMENTLHNGENLLIEKISHKISGLKRYDIIVFYPHGREYKEYYVKRVIGLPGETVQIIDDIIYVDGEALDEHYRKDEHTLPGIAEDPISLGDNEIFVLGDNRKVSSDSRYEDVGPVDLHNVEGKVMFRVWPLKKIGVVH